MSDKTTREQMYCSETDRFYLADTYPRKCSCCDKVFPDRETYLNETELLPTGIYSETKKHFILEYRNCACGSTIVISMSNVRDETEEGIQNRQEFQKNMEKLMATGLSPEEAREQLLQKKVS